MTEPSRQPRVFVLPLDAALLERTEGYGGFSTDGERYAALARALTSSPLWAGMEGCVLVVRAEPPARLAVLGRFTEEELVRLEALSGQVELTLGRLRYIGWADAEKATAELAQRLLQRFDRPAIDRFHYVPLPRGGLFVLGMLAYLLDLGRDRVGMGQDEAPLVVVDDCALTGLRFHHFMDRCEGRQVIFAHLYSHPDLREKIESHEPAVVAAIAARDLNDLAPHHYGEEYGDWLSRWKKRSDAGAYWIGLPEHMCFAWNEPDVTIWNHVSQREEAVWRVVPPELCLKNRPLASEAAGCQMQPRGAGGIRPGPDVVYGVLGEEVVAADCATGSAFSFTGIAREMWDALLRTGDPQRVVDELAPRYEVAPSVLRRDVDSFLHEAVRLGLLISLPQ